MRYIFIIIFALLLASCRPAPADLILHNGVVWTADPGLPDAEAVAIRDGEIVAVGSTESMEPLLGSGTTSINLNGQFVTPGFIDTHVHMASAARFLEFNIMRASAQAEFVEKVDELVQRLPEGEWILGGLWGAYDQWTAGSAGNEQRTAFTPQIALVEAMTERHPLFIRRFDNSAFAANRAAMAAAGLDPATEPPPGVRYGRDAAGQFNGLLYGEGVLPLFDGVIPPFSYERRKLQTLAALAYIRENGVTTISDMSDDDQLAIYRDLKAAGDLTVRVEFRYGLDRWSELANQGIRIGSGDPWIRLGALKGHIDGIMGTSSARFLKPYDHDSGNRGRWRRLMVDDAGQFVEGQFLKYMLDADRAGLQLSIHAIGDEANRLLMDYLDSLAVHNGPKDRRFRLVHAQVIAPEDVARLGELGIIAEVQPYHLSDDMRWMEERIGHERSKGAYAFKSIAESGARLAFGSDWPGTSASDYPINPLLGIYASVTRQTLTGLPEAGWFPDERISIEEALQAYTADAAYALFEEDVKGAIKEGLRADLTVLSRDLLAATPDAYLRTDVTMTIVDGQVVYQR